MSPHPEIPTEQTRSRAMPLSRLTVSALLLCALALAAVYALRSRGAHDRLHGDADEMVAAVALKVNSLPADKRAPFLLASLRGPEPSVRYAAIDELVNLHPQGATDALVAAFEDSSSAVRQRAMEALPQLDRERGTRLQIAALRDDDTWIREAAAAQITTRLVSGKGRTSTVDVPILVRSLDDPSRVVAGSMMSCLRILTGKRWHASPLADAGAWNAAVGAWKRWYAGQGDTWLKHPSQVAIGPVRPTRSDPAPAFDITDTAGRRIQLQTQRGRVTLLNFWGTWCPPCQAEALDLARIDHEFRQSGVDTVGVALQEPEGAAGLTRWCAERRIDFAQALATPEIVDAYGGVSEVPVTVLIDQAGRIRYRWEGERDYRTFRAAIVSVLGRPSAAVSGGHEK